MQIRTLPELPRSLYPQIAALSVLDGDPPLGIEHIRRLQRLGYPSSDYFAFYAVDGGQVMSKVETIEVPFTSTSGEAIVTGISEVLTRPDGTGHGYARRLMRAAHLRERAQGRRWSLLWTRRTWGAHRLYEQLGYRDVYSYPSALKRIARRSGGRAVDGYRLDPVRRSGLSRVNRLLARSTKGRVGFVRRFPGSFRARLALGWVEPSHYRVLVRRGVDVGYARAVKGVHGVVVEEAVIVDPRHLAALIDALERLAAGGWLSVSRTSFVADAATELRERGYQVFSTAHATMMARPLGARPGGPDDPRVVCASPQFSCHRGDTF